nr:hypothetical protein CFP56_59273 [Quercus suber]
MLHLHLSGCGYNAAELDFGHLPDFCVARKDTWIARVPLVCFCIVEIHHPDCVLRQYDGSREHNHVRRILHNVAGLGGDPAAIGQANNCTKTESATTATLSTSATPISTPTCGRRATASPSTSAARGHGQPVTASPSTTVARGRGRPAITSPSTSATRGHGRRATTPRVVSSPEILAPVLHASPQPEVPPPILDASPQSEVPPPMPDTDVPDEHPPHQLSPPRGRPQRARRAPTYGTGGHKIGHKGSSMHDDEPKDDAPQPPPLPKHYTRVKKRKIGD